MIFFACFIANGTVDFIRKTCIVDAGSFADELAELSGGRLVKKVVNNKKVVNYEVNDNKVVNDNKDLLECALDFEFAKVITDVLNTPGLPFFMLAERDAGFRVDRQGRTGLRKGICAPQRVEILKTYILPTNTYEYRLIATKYPATINLTCLKLLKGMVDLLERFVEVILTPDPRILQLGLDLSSKRVEFVRMEHEKDLFPGFFQISREA